MIDSNRGAWDPMETGTEGRGPCKMCSGSDWNVNESRGEVNCNLCGYVQEENMLIQHPKKIEEAPGSRKKKGEVIPGIRGSWSRRVYSAGNTPGRGSGPTKKVREIHLELERMCFGDDLEHAKDLVNRVKRAQDRKLLTSNQSQKWAIIKPGRTPAEVHAFCIAGAIVIRIRRDRGDDEFSVGDLLKLVEGEYCNPEGEFVIGGEGYKPRMKYKGRGIGKPLVSIINEHRKRIDRLVPPVNSIQRIPQNAGRSREVQVQTNLRSFNNYLRRAEARGASMREESSDFHNWCMQEQVLVHNQFSRCTDGTKKVLSAILASEFLDWSVFRLMQSEGLTATLSPKLKESAEILISAWKSSTEGYTAGSEVDGS